MAINPLLNPIRNVANKHDVREYVEKLDDAVPRTKGIIYIHVPFCPSICTYCSYDRVKYGKDDEEDYVHHLLEEMNLYSRKKLIQSAGFFAVHIGGGTPNMLSDGGIRTILNTLRNSFNIEKNAVINVEIGSKAYSREKLALLKDLGCNRLSFGVQSFDPGVRKRSALTTSNDGLKEMINDIKQFGFDINFDLMFGLPGQDEEIWESDLRKAVEFEPASLDVYCYYPINSKYYSLYKRKQAFRSGYRVEMPNEETILKMTEMTFTLLCANGYVQETAEDFAKPGKFSIIKAVGYTKNEISDNYIYLGMGPNSIGNINPYVYRNKFYNVPRTKSYLSDSSETGGFPIFLLRKNISPELKNLVLFPKVIKMKKARIGHRLLHEFSSRIEDLKARNLIMDDGDNFMLTDLGKLWIDNISYEFMNAEMKANFEDTIFSYSEA